MTSCGSHGAGGRSFLTEAQLSQGAGQLLSIGYFLVTLASQFFQFTRRRGHQIRIAKLSVPGQKSCTMDCVVLRVGGRVDVRFCGSSWLTDSG